MLQFNLTLLLSYKVAFFSTPVCFQANYLLLSFELK